MNDSGRGTPAWYDEPGTAFLSKQVPTLAAWLSRLSRDDLVHHIAQAIAWVSLTRDARTQTPNSIAEAIVCFFEEDCRG